MFSKYYQHNDNWQVGLNSRQIIEQLRSFYPGYFTESGIDYEKLRHDLSTSLNQDAYRQAKQLFYNLFPIPYKATRCSFMSQEPLKSIKEKFGAGIIAHGMEEAKNGNHTILLITLTGQVQVPATNWGPLEDGLANISSAPHGPYYLIYWTFNSALSDTLPPDNPNYPRLTEIQQILVPYQENINMLNKVLDDMVTCQLITADQQNTVLSKLITYKDFYIQLEYNARANTCKRKRSFFDSPSTDSSSSSPSSPADHNSTSYGK